MQFGDFVFQVEPEKLQIAYKRNYKMSPSGGGWIITDSALMGRVISGESYFYGAYAYSDFQVLSISLNSGTPAQLTLPNWGTIKALLTDLVMLETPGENVVHYSFSFVEVP